MPVPFHIRTNPQSVPSGKSRRIGFTLIEVLIALGLSVALLTLVYAAIELSWRYQTAGQDEMRSGQVSRAVLKMLREDVESIAFQLPEDDEEETDEEEETVMSATSDSEGTTDDEDSTSGGTSATDTETIVFGGLSESGTPPTFGLIGNAETLYLSVSRPARDLSYGGVISDTEVPMRTSDLLRVTSGLADTSTGLTGSASRGFARREFDLFSATAYAPGLSTQDVIASEITAIEFRYFDGLSWYSEWDSFVNAQLPAAIEVSLQFELPIREGAFGQLTPETNGTSRRTRVFWTRSTIALPLADRQLSQGF